MKVFILATVRNEVLLPYTLLVFKTLRIGFPTAEVIVTGNIITEKNPLQEWAIGEVMAACEKSGCRFSNGPATIHHDWITKLLTEENEPFVILDTDVIFYEKVEDWKFDTALAGFRVPEFFDEFTNAITRSRLHTSLMFIKPVELQVELLKYDLRFPNTVFNPRGSLIDPICIPLNGRGYFHDTMSLAYHAIGGTAFTDQQKELYAHLNFGTLEDLVLPRLTNGEQMKQARDMILNHPESGRGMWRHQEEYYRSRQPIVAGKEIIAPETPETKAEAQAWCYELCRGDKDAMAFCNLWYWYVHSIDDMIDTVQDGRPTMSKRQMVSLFFGAAILYNTAFYKKNQELLFSLILDITNTYITSVEWEVSPEKHKRQMADLMRMSANRLYSMVALIVGGEIHMQEINQRLFDRDWKLQHDELGDPI